jgi:hypothetical protein
MTNFQTLPEVVSFKTQHLKKMNKSIEKKGKGKFKDLFSLFTTIECMLTTINRSEN